MKPKVRHLTLAVATALLLLMMVASLTASAESPTIPPRDRPKTSPERVSRPAPALLLGGSTISGILNFDDTWGPGVISVTGDILITSAVTIDIVPGTTIRMATGDGLFTGSDPTRVEFVVDGTLNVNGPVTFTSQNVMPQCGDWVGIYYNTGSNGYLDDTVVEYGMHAVQLNTANPITISDSFIRHNCHAPPIGSAWGAGLIIHAGTHTIDNTAIHDNMVLAAPGGSWAEGGGVYINPGAGPSLFNDCRIYNNQALNPGGSAAGAGMNIFGSDPILHNCDIYLNDIHAGGGVYGGGVFIGNGSSTVIEAGTKIRLNLAESMWSSAYGGGVGIDLGAPAPIIRDSQILSNHLLAPNVFSTTVYAYGGGIGIYAGSQTGTVITNTEIGWNHIFIGFASSPSLFPTACGGGIGLANGATAALIDRNLIHDNFLLTDQYGYARGAGICLHYNNLVTVTNNLIAYNHSNNGLVSGVATAQGGGIYANDANSYLINNTIVSNSLPVAGAYGGGVYLPSGNLINNIIVSNTVANSGGGVYSAGNPGYNDVWNNSPNNYAPGVPPVTDISPADPLFVGSGGLAQRYHLRPGSPCVDTGTGTGIGIPTQDYDGMNRPIGGGYDIGFDEVPLYAYLPLVLRNH
jgi:hypothetical protein